MKPAFRLSNLVTIVVLVVLVYGSIKVLRFVGSYLEKKREIATLRAVIGRLESERRVAQVYVLGRVPDEKTGTYRTTIEFLEFDRAGLALPRKEAVLVGNEVYFEALVIKFGYQYVEMGEELRGKTIVLFRRIFGSQQLPDEGVPIDEGAADGIPDVYRVAPRASRYERELWRRFWGYANDPGGAQLLGVRVMQVEAVGNRLESGKTYELTVESAGGINLKPLASASL